MTDFTDQEKLACLEREVKALRWAYPKRVHEGIMPPSLATREIALMGKIAADYRARVQPALAF
jgi:hypothetical protein